MCDVFNTGAIWLDSGHNTSSMPVGSGASLEEVPPPAPCLLIKEETRDGGLALLERSDGVDEWEEARIMPSRRIGVSGKPAVCGTAKDAALIWADTIRTERRIWDDQTAMACTVKQGPLHPRSQILHAHLIGKSEM
jgi:hypothetical protein